MISKRYSRQSFLGDDSERQIQNTRIGIVGLGGGGSHIVQQLSHIGFRDYVLYEPDHTEIWNLNRTVRATAKDAESRTKKMDVGCRSIYELHPGASVLRIGKRWQEEPEHLRECDIVFGCVDGYQEKHELEVSMRRYLVPYIDIGLTVIHKKPRPALMSGHVFLSMPDKPCMWCLGLLSEGKVAEEARQYGDIGSNPQVVWANGVLASTAVGIAVDMVTGWTQSSPEASYYLYEGNKGIIQPHIRLEAIDLTKTCTHHPSSDVGDPIL